MITGPIRSDSDWIIIASSPTGQFVAQALQDLSFPFHEIHISSFTLAIPIEIFCIFTRVNAPVGQDFMHDKSSHKTQAESEGIILGVNREVSLFSGSRRIAFAGHTSAQSPDPRSHTSPGSSGTLPVGRGLRIPWTTWTG